MFLYSLKQIKPSRLSAMPITCFTSVFHCNFFVWITEVPTWTFSSISLNWLRVVPQCFLQQRGIEETLLRGHENVSVGRCACAIYAIEKATKADAFSTCLQSQGWSEKMRTTGDWDQPVEQSHFLQLNTFQIKCWFAHEGQAILSLSLWRTFLRSNMSPWYLISVSCSSDNFFLPFLVFLASKIESKFQSHVIASMNAQNWNEWPSMQGR